MNKEKIFSWFDERYSISKLFDIAKHKTVPVHRGSVWYYFGGVTLFLFIVQVCTGIMLLLYYRVGADTSNESLRFIVTKVPFGWLIRSIHSWAANLMVLSALIHMFSVYFERSYQKPREITWISGILLLALAMGFGFSGYLLPWNELSYFATKVGTETAGVLPFVGKFALKFLRGSEDVTGATLSRFFGLHAAILPGIFTVVLVVHLLLIQMQGMSEPHNAKLKKPMPFFPNFVMRDLLLWLLVLNLLALLAVFFPWELGKKADPFASAPAGIKPEWYFLAVFQMLKFLPAKFLGIEGELFGVFGIGILMTIWAVFPFIDSKQDNGKTKRWVTAFGIVLVTGFVAMTVLGWVLS